MVIIDKRSGTALLTGANLALDRAGASGPGWINPDMTTGNAKLISKDLPGPFWPETWRWDGQAWQALRVPEEALQEVVRRIDEQRERRIAAGMPWRFADGVGTVQMRHERDMTNLVALATWANLMLTQGQAQASMPFRDQVNVTHTLTATEMAQMSQAALQWVSQHYVVAWQLKARAQQLAADGRLVELLEFDYDAGWPSPSLTTVDAP